jgi:hypothetical protein
MSERHQEEHGSGAGFEREDLGSRPIFGFLISLVIVGILIYYLLWGMFRFLDVYNRQHERPVSPMVIPEEETRTADRTQMQQFPEPRLEENERTELNDFRYGEEERLNSYGWVDPSAGIVHIPITRAIELIAQQGLPTTPQAGAGPAPSSAVNLANQAAAKSDTSAMPQGTAQKKAKRK